jgi:hypothetical protein
MRQPGVFHFEDDGNPHIDVYVIDKTERRPHLTLVTGGMADRACPGPRDGDAVANPPPKRIELMTHAEADETQITRLALILRELASLPFGFGVTLAPGALVRGSRPVFPGATLRHAVITADVTPPEPFLVDGGEEVRFLLVEFVTENEFRHGVAHGGEDLVDVLREMGVPKVLRPTRLTVL